MTYSFRAIALAPALALSLAAAPAAAQDDGDGFNLMQEGANLFMRGLMDEMDPALDQLRSFAEDLEPALQEMTAEMAAGLADVLETVDSIRYYEMPEVMENGDIIIRRRADAPPYEPPVADEDELDPGAEVEL
ncbi:hypothetical protein ACXN5S_04725 [Pseudoroseicyclus sp. H15]